jgi:hypothetical protein
MILGNIFAEKMSLFTHNAAVLCRKWIITYMQTLVFRKQATFFAKVDKNRWKVLIITLNPGTLLGLNLFSTQCKNEFLGQRASLFICKCEYRLYVSQFSGGYTVFYIHAYPSTRIVYMCILTVTLMYLYCLFFFSVYVHVVTKIMHWIDFCWQSGKSQCWT